MGITVNYPVQSTEMYSTSSEYPISLTITSGTVSYDITVEYNGISRTFSDTVPGYPMGVYDSCKRILGVSSFATGKTINIYLSQTSSGGGASRWLLATIQIKSPPAAVKAGDKITWQNAYDYCHMCKQTYKYYHAGEQPDFPTSLQNKSISAGDIITYSKGIIRPSVGSTITASSFNNARTTCMNGSYV